MSDHSAIEWTDATWNPIRGCTRVSEGCRHCYAERVAARFSGPGLAYEGLAIMREGEPRWTGVVQLVEKHLDDPLRWRTPRRIFVNSMSDLFHETLLDETIDQIFGVMARAPHHTFQVLTKRPQRMEHYVGNAELPERLEALTGVSVRNRWPLPNVWLGVSTENQATANERIPSLLETPAAVRFISAEPLLGSIVIDSRHMVGDETYWDFLRGLRGATVQHAVIRPTKTARLDWVIVGGESGPEARPMHPLWAKWLRDDCVRAGVPFFFKQWGEWAPLQYLSQHGDPLLNISCNGRKECVLYANDDTLETRRLTAANLRRVGKKLAGRDLDDRTWDEMPRGIA